MKALIICCATVGAMLSACILVPAPHMALLVFTIAAPELSPWLVISNLLIAVAALRWFRPAVPLALAALLVACGPVFQIHNALAAEGHASSASVVFDCLRGAGSGSVQPKRLPMNILYYAPPGDGSQDGAFLRPALIDIYGGAWAHGSPGDMHGFDSYMALKGLAVFAIEYRHAPQFRFPAQLDDVNAAVSWLRKNAAEYGVDGKRFVLCGRSAGAELALLAAYETGVEPVRAVISYYGPTDLMEGYRDVPVPDPIHVRAVLEAYLGGSPAQVPEAYRAASPVNYVRPSLPPTLIIQGRRDHIVKERFARELYEGLLRRGNQARLVEIPWSEHGFDFVFPGLGNQVALRYLQDFLHDFLGG